MRILVVEDSPPVRTSLERVLRSQGYRVECVGDGASALRALALGGLDGVVLDVGLPDVSGLEVCQRLRAGGDRVPVLMLTARDAVADRVAGLDAGADDYLVKPVALDELAARLRAVTRRAQGRAEPVWRYGALEYWPAAKRAAWRGHPVDLTTREASLLEVFLANPQRVLAKAQIIEKLYGWGEEIESNALEVYVHHLRRKIDPRIVRTVRGVGYALGPADAKTRQ